MVVSELVAVLGAKVDAGQFADVFALLDKVQVAALKMADLVAAGVTKGFDSIHKVAMAADTVSMVSEQFGIAADALQELQYAATLSDSSAEGLTHGLKFLSKAAAEAGSGSKEAAEAFRGIKIKDANGMLGVQDILENVADKFQTLPNGVEKTNLALKLFGRQGAELIPLLNRGADGVEALRAEARAMGVVLDTKTIKAGERYDDQLKRLNFTFDALQKKFAAPLIAKVTDLFDRLSKTLTSKGMARAVDALSTGFEHLILAAGAVIDLFGWLTQNETVVTVAIFAITSAVVGLAAWAVTLGLSFTGAAAAAIAAWVGAAAPFLALGALIVLIADDILTFIEGGDSALGDLIAWLSEIDPESTPFVKMLKTAGSLLFDLTNEAKWKRMGQAITDWVLSPITALVDSLHWVLDKLGVADKFNPNVKTSLDEIAPMSGGFPGMSDPLNTGGQSFGDAFAAKFPGVAPLVDKLDGWNMSAGNFVSSRFNETGAGNIPGGGSNTTTIGDVNVILPPGATATDPDAIGSAVRKAVREELGTELSNAQGAVGT
jgi:hypothetical protein